MTRISECTGITLVRPREEGVHTLSGQPRRRRRRRSLTWRARRCVPWWRQKICCNLRPAPHCRLVADGEDGEERGKCPREVCNRANRQSQPKCSGPHHGMITPHPCAWVAAMEGRADGCIWPPGDAPCAAQVDYYGAPTPLRQLGNVSAPEANLLVVNVYDKSAMQARLLPMMPTWPAAP